MDQKDICLLIVIVVLVGGSDGMTKPQFKKAGAALKKQCMAKNDVTEEKIGKIEQGKFVEEKEVMCYIACIYQMTQCVKNNKLNYDASVKQINLMYPADIKETALAALANCRDFSKKYKDLCEASYWAAKCMYDYNPTDFAFP